MGIVRWGLLSTANINRRVIPAIRASRRGQLVAIASRSLASAQDYATHWEIPLAFGSYEEMLASNQVDAVYISLPNERDIILFTIGQVEISAQLLDAKFPPFESVIPKDYSTSTVMYRSDLLAACARAEIFARDSAFSGRLYVKPPKRSGDPGEVMIVGRSQERGDNEGVLDATVEGEPVDISFNIKYLIDVLRILPDEQVILQSKGAANPGVIRPLGRDNYLYVIMPMAR